MVAELVAAFRRALVDGGWGRASSVAGLGFLAVLGVGAAFIGVLKIFDPSFGSGRGIPWVVVRIVVSGLASLGIPIQQVRGEGAVLPLGSLFFVAWTLVWAARNVAERSAAAVSERIVQGLKIGVPFALLSFVAAIVFRVRDTAEVGANPAAALLIAALWGSFFGAIGGATAGGGLRRLIASRRAAPRHRILTEGVTSGLVMVIAGSALACATVLVGLIFDLAAGSDLALSAGDALAIVFVVVVFAPNLTAGALAFSSGAPIAFVAQSLGVRVERDFSLLGWDAGGPEWYFYPLLLIPIAACLLGGYVARRRSADPRRFLEVMGIASCSFGVMVAAFAYLGGVSLDRAFLGEGNLFVLRADPGPALFMSVVWGAGAGALGWKLGEAQSSTTRRIEAEG